MEETHPPEMPLKPRIYESLGPTSDKSLVSSVEFSSATDLLAVGYEDGLVEVHLFESYAVYPLDKRIHDLDLRTRRQGLGLSLHIQSSGCDSSRC